MRWPLSLLFRGDRDAPTAVGDAAAAGPGAPVAAPGPALAAGAPPRPAAWSSLPPVQRAAGEIPLTAPTATFVRDLAGRHPLEAILRPLAHDVAADGPAGLVSGIATPLVVPAPTASPPGDHVTALPGPHAVQRRARTTSVATSPSRAAEGSVGTAPDRDLAEESAPEPVVTPRALPVVPPPAMSPALAATRVEPASAPEPARALAPVAGPSVQRSSASVPGALPSARGAAPDPSPTPGEPATDPVNDEPATDAADGPSPASAVVQRRTLGESRRLGLGAPLGARPASLGSGAEPSLPLARAARPSPPARASSTAEAPPRPATAAPAPLPVLRLAAATPTRHTPAVERGQGAGTVTPAEGSGDAFASSGDDGPGGSSPTRAAADRPLVGDPGRRTLMPASTPASTPGDADTGDVDAGDGNGDAGASAELPLAVLTAGGTSGVPQSAPSAASPAVDELAGAATVPTDAAARVPAAALALSAPLVVARSMRGSGPALTSALAAIPEGAPPVVARRATGGAAGISAGPTGTGASGMGATVGWRHGGPSVVGRQFAGSGAASSGVSPVQRASHGGPADLPATELPATELRPATDLRLSAGSAATALGAGARRETLPVARLAVPRSSTVASSAPEPVPVARLADGDGGGSTATGGALGWTAGAGFAPVPPEVGEVVQRIVQIDEVSSAVESQPAAAAGAGGAGSGSGAGQDYEEIADRVYDRIRTRFATELLLDRERMGLLIDG